MKIYRKKISVKDDFSEKDEMLLRDAKTDINRVVMELSDIIEKLQDVYTPIDRTKAEVIKAWEAARRAYDSVRKDLGYEQYYGNPYSKHDSEDEYRIIKKAGSYLICKGKWVVAQYEDEREAKRNLIRLRTGDPIDKE